MAGTRGNNVMIELLALMFLIVNSSTAKLLGRIGSVHSIVYCLFKRYFVNEVATFFNRKTLIVTIDTSGI